jgi:hypothetical protein
MKQKKVTLRLPVQKSGVVPPTETVSEDCPHPALGMDVDMTSPEKLAIPGLGQRRQGLA